MSSTSERIDLGSTTFELSDSGNPMSTDYSSFESTRDVELVQENDVTLIENTEKRDYRRFCFDILTTKLYLSVFLIFVLFVFYLVIGCTFLSIGFSTKGMNEEGGIREVTHGEIYLMDQKEIQIGLNDYECSGFCHSSECEQQLSEKNERRDLGTEEIRRKVSTFLQKLNSPTRAVLGASQLFQMAKEHLIQDCIDEYYQECEELDTIEAYVEECEQIPSDSIPTYSGEGELSDFPEEIFGPSCGPNQIKWVANMIPDQLVYGEEYTIDFGSLCDEHDLCYEDVEREKEICDEEFYCALKFVCRDELPHSVALKNCLEYAVMYKNGVEIGGWPSFVGTHLLCEYDSRMERISHRYDEYFRRPMTNMKKKMEENIKKVEDSIKPLF